MALAERRHVEALARFAHQIELALDRGSVEVRIERGDLRYRHLELAGQAGIAVEQTDFSGLHLHRAGEIAPAPDRPGDRRTVERERLLDLVEQVEWVAALPVHLADEGHDR